MPLRIRKEIAQPPTEIDTSVAIGWLHTASFNPERKADITEEEIGGDGNEEDPDEKLDG